MAVREFRAAVACGEDLCERCERQMWSRELYAVVHKAIFGLESRVELAASKTLEICRTHKTKY